MDSADELMEPKCMESFDPIEILEIEEKVWLSPCKDEAVQIVPYEATEMSWTDTRNMFTSIMALISLLSKLRPFESS